MNNPTKDKKGSDRVFRSGGFWINDPSLMRASSRDFNSFDPTYPYKGLGFRIVRNK